IAAMSLRGYCRTFNVFIACNPAMRMTKLTTIASTGRLMKRSVNDVISLTIRHSEWSKAQSPNPVASRESYSTGPLDFARDDIGSDFFRHSSFALRHSHHVSGGLGLSSGFGARSLFTLTAIPLRNLKTPVLTTVSPVFKPCVTATKSPRASPMRTNCCRRVSDSLPAFGSFCFSIRKTELPYGAYDTADPGITTVFFVSAKETSTFANIPGCSAWSGLSNVACNGTLRVTGSTIELIAVNFPLNSRPGNASDRTVTSRSFDSFERYCSGNAKST